MSSFGPTPARSASPGGVRKSAVFDLPEAAGKAIVSPGANSTTAKKVAPGCYPMPLLAILPGGKIDEGRSYAASSSVSSVVGWLLFALVTKRCLISAFCSCTLDAPAGVLSIA